MNRDKKRAVVIAGNRFVPPFNLTLSGDGELLECTDLLRLVPGKRAVLLCKWRGKPVVAKLFYKRFRAGKHVEMEAEGNRLLKKAEIPTAGILYSGPVRENRAKALIFEYIHPSENLGAVLQSSRDLDQCRDYLEKLMVLLARMHEVGLQHNDLHLDNFLVKDKDLYALDGSALEEKHPDAPLDTGASLKNLAILFAQRNIGDRLVFKALFSVYCAARNLENTDELVSTLEARIKERRKVRTHRYLKKIYRQSTETVCQKTITSFLLCKRASYTPAMASFLKNPDVAFDLPGSAILKSGNTATVVRFKVDGKDLVVKRYNVKNPVHGLRLAFKKSRADRSWFGGHLLLEYGINTPKPIAMREVRLGPFRNRAYLICDYIEGTSAREYFEEPPSKGENDLPQQILRIFEGLESLLVSHGDMKATNIMIHDGQAFLIDLDSMAVHKSKAGFARARRKDVKRFMKNWTCLPEVARLFHSLK
jgi:tRNA A-37 threonylcarbamoyl transferase component Bud32